jgi:hypothetical protein
MKKYFISGLILFSSILFLISCKTVAVLPTNRPLKNVNLESLVSKIKSNYPRVDKVRSRIKATYDNGKREQQVIVQLRMENKKKLWLSATMLIPIAKLMITPDKVSFYEKFQKTYFEGGFDLINRPFGTNFRYSDIENIFLGKPILDPGLGKWKQISNPQYYILIPQSKRLGLKPTLFFDPVSFLLKEQRIIIPGSKYSISIKYLRHIRLEGKSIPSFIKVILFDGEETQSLDLEFTRTYLTEGLTFPFEIPQGYSKINL